jgi:hypothetical protein
MHIYYKLTTCQIFAQAGIELCFARNKKSSKRTDRMSCTVGLTFLFFQLQLSSHREHSVHAKLLLLLQLLPSSEHIQ